jgi:hypothetical protein
MKILNLQVKSLGTNILVTHNNKINFDNNHNEIWIAHIKVIVWQCQWDVTSNVVEDVELKITQKRIHEQSYKMWRKKHQKNKRNYSIAWSSMNLNTRVQVWLGYPKGLSHLISNGPPHLNMSLKLNSTFILKVFFFINTYIIKVLFYA